MEILSSSDFLSSSPFEILSLNTPPSKPKLIKNLREFWTIGKSKGESEDSAPFSENSSKSSTISDFESMRNLADTDSNGQVFFDDPPEVTEPFEGNRAEQLGKFVQFSKSLQTSSSNPVEISTTTSVGGALSQQKDENLKNEKSEEKENSRIRSSSSTTSGRDNNTNAGAEFEDPNNQKKGVLLDPERRSQISGVDSEHDSGHCYSESMEMLENSLQEPEFQSGSRKLAKIPDFLGGNPFLMFLCLTLLLQHRDHIIRNQMDYNETAMYFDKMIRKHNVSRVLAHARMLYSEYLKQNVPRA